MMKKEIQTREDHIKRHQELHAALDELLADYVLQTEKLLSETNLLELVKWSWEQVQDPTHRH
jgi:hypothetical protein